MLMAPLWDCAGTVGVDDLPCADQEDDDDDEADWHPSTEDDAGGAADNDAAGGAADNSASDNAADDSVTDAQAEDNDSGDTQIPWYSRLWRALQGVKPDPTGASCYVRIDSWWTVYWQADAGCAVT